MLDGITILNTINEVNQEATSTSYILAGVTAFFLVIGFIFIVVGIKEHEEQITKCGIVILIMATLASLATSISTVSVEHTYYEVTIDESVSMVEFYNKYEIIEVRGQIYKIKEKDSPNGES